jgi:hypothetical protein
MQVDGGFWGTLTAGPELLDPPTPVDDRPGGRIAAISGTGFNPDNVQHRFHSDAGRYAIAIQQARDRKDFALADLIRAEVAKQGRGKSFRVENLPDRTVIHIGR